MNKITHEELLEALDYCGVTGKFYWKVTTTRRVKIGDEAGSVHSKGYLTIGYKGVRYFAHILAWFYIYKQWPSKLVDHRDTNKLNNAILNLREASYSQNGHNMSIHKDNLAGYKGVRKLRNKFQARILVGTSTAYLGCFLDPKDAARAYDQAAVQHFGQFALTNKSLGLI